MAVAILCIILVLARKTSVSTDTETKRVPSSYDQKTNHFVMPPVDMGPIQGSESPFQVNQWLSYQV